MPLLSTRAPKISGSKQVGRTLTAVAGRWSEGGVKVGYQWLRNGKPISGAKSTKYKLVAADAGARIGLREELIRSDAEEKSGQGDERREQRQLQPGAPEPTHQVGLVVHRPGAGSVLDDPLEAGLRIGGEKRGKPGRIVEHQPAEEGRMVEHRTEERCHALVGLETREANAGRLCRHRKVCQALLDHGLRAGAKPWPDRCRK